MNSNLIFTSNIFHLLSHALDVHRALQAPIHTPSSKRMIHTPSEEAPTRERERDREPRKPKIVAPPASHTDQSHRPTNPGSSHREPTNRESHRANRTDESHCEPMNRESRCANHTSELHHELTNPLPISFSFSFEIFVIKFVCDFDFLLSLFDL